MYFVPASLATAVVIGVISGLNINLILQVIAVCISLAISLIVSAIKREINIVILVIICGFAVGSCAAMWTVSDRNNKAVNHIGRYVTLEGVTLSQGQESNTGDYYKYPLRIKTIDRGGEVFNVNETVLLTTPVKLSCGESVSAKGILKDLPGIMNENGFDAEKYYKSQGIFTRMYTEDVSEIDDIKIFSLKLIGGKISEYIDSVIYKYYSGDTAAILSAVLTGNTHRFSEEYDKQLDATSFKRLFHPAYVHIMLVTFLLSLIATHVSARFRNISALILLILMAVCNSGSIGFIRCTVTAAAAIFYKMKNGHVHTPDILAWIVIGFVLSSPLIIYNIGFVLSVTAAIIIWAFFPIINKYFQAVPRIFRRTAGVTILCTVFQLPLTAYYFDGICPYAIILPFIMIPLIIVIIISAPISFIMYDLFGNAPVIGAYLEGCIWLILRLPGWIQGLPFSNILLRTPTKTELLSSAGFVFALYYYIKGKNNRALYFGTICVGLIAASGVMYISKIGTTDFTFVNVGQGDGAVINTHMGGCVIIDGGGGMPYSEFNPGESIFVPYLMSKGYDDIDAAILTHFHKDHVEGVIAAVEMLNVKQVFVPAVEDSWEDDMNMYKAELENAALRNGTEITYISEDTKITFDCGINIYLYVPGELLQLSDDSNDKGILVKAEYGNTKAIYSGDFGQLAERSFINDGVDVSADIMKVGHHGSSGSSCEEWIDAVDPSYAVISCGEDNVYGHPSSKTLERLSGIPTLRTDINGTITFTADKEDIKEIYVLK